MKMVATILWILISSAFIARADSLDKKKDEYKTTCQQTAVRFLTDSKEYTDNNKMIFAAIMTCKEIMADLDSGKKWNLVKDAKFDGCSDAVRLLLPKGTTENAERVHRAKYCAQHLNL